MYFKGTLPTTAASQARVDTSYLRDVLRAHAPEKKKLLYLVAVSR